MNKRQKRIFSIVALIIIIIFVLGSIILPVLPTKADSLSDLQNAYNALQKQQEQTQKQIQSNKDQQSSVSAQINSLNQQISLSKKQVSVLNQQISALDAQIASRQNDINAKQAAIESNYALFKQRLCALYKTGTYTYIDVLLSSDTITDFLMKNQILKTVSLHDTTLLNTLRNDMQAVKNAQSELQKSQASLKMSQTNMVAKQNSLSQQQTQQQSLNAQLGQQANALTKENNDLLDKEQQVSSQIQQATQTMFSSGGSGPVGTGQFLWPVPSSSVISCAFGMRTNPYSHTSNDFHDGIDISAASGAPIVAADDGTVRLNLTIAAANMKAVYGDSYVFIDHHNGYITFYGHCSRRADFLQNNGDGKQVKKGQVIAYVGSQGYSTGPHLHFGIYTTNGPINPENFFKF